MFVNICCPVGIQHQGWEATTFFVLLYINPDFREKGPPGIKMLFALPGTGSDRLTCTFMAQGMFPHGLALFIMWRYSYLCLLLRFRSFFCILVAFNQNRR